MNLRSNGDHLVTVSAMGQIASPGFPGLPALPYQLSAEGQPFLLPAFGGIVYNVSVGDPAFGWLADCVHPGVSIALADDNGNRGLNILSCVGNVGVVMSGGAQGARGVVTGKSGRFADQVILHFPRAVREQMAIGDKIVVRTQGVGLQLTDHPDVKLKSCAPGLLDSLEVTSDDAGRLAVAGGWHGAAAFAGRRLRPGQRRWLAAYPERGPRGAVRGRSRQPAPGRRGRSDGAGQQLESWLPTRRERGRCGRAGR